MTERPPSSDADGSWEAWTDLRPNTPEEQARIDRAAAIKSWFQPSPDQHPAPAAVPPSSDAAGWKSAIGSGNSRTVFDFPDGTTGPGTWDPKTQTIVKAYSTDTIEGPSSDAGSPIDVERLAEAFEKVQPALYRRDFPDDDPDDFRFLNPREHAQAIAAEYTRLAADEGPADPEEATS